MVEFNPERRAFLKQSGKTLTGAAAAMALPDVAFAQNYEKIETIPEMLKAIIDFHNSILPEIQALGDTPIEETFVQNKFAGYAKGQTIEDSFQKDVEYVVKKLSEYKSHKDGAKLGKELSSMYIENLSHYMSLIQLAPANRQPGSEQFKMSKSLWEKYRALRVRFGKK